MITYEQLLNQNRRQALLEGSRHFEKERAAHKALAKIVRALETLRLPYAIADETATFLHGYRRFTEDGDILVSSEGLQKIYEELEGWGVSALVHRQQEFA